MKDNAETSVMNDTWTGGIVDSADTMQWYNHYLPDPLPCFDMVIGRQGGDADIPYGCSHGEIVEHLMGL